MYFISILALVLVTIIGCLIGSPATVLDFFDVPCILLILLVDIPILLSSGLLKDFNNAFRIALGKERSITVTELKRAIEAVNLMSKTTLYSGLFLFMIEAIITLHRLDDPASLGPTISVSLLFFLYTSGLAIILLPLKSILNVRMITLTETQDAKTASPDTVPEVLDKKG